MNEDESRNDAEQSPRDDAGRVDREMILELNFVPAWARKPPTATRHEERPPRDGRSARPRRHDDRSPRQPYQPRRDRAPSHRPRIAPDAQAQTPHHDLRIRILPAQKEISSIVRRISATKRAYPMHEIAALFINNPDACDAKIEIVESERDARLYQCRICRFASLEQETTVCHILGEHFDEFYRREEIPTDPPSGEFTCVAKCGLSGALLGPPNHHSYSGTLQEVHRTRFANMPFEEYRSRVEMVHDSELIDQWKKESATRTVFRRVGAPEDEEPAGRAQAEDLVRREHIPSLLHVARQATMPASVAQRISEHTIAGAFRAALRREKASLFALTLALRAAFRHKRLHVFKTGAGMYFAAAREPAPLNPDHAVAPIREVLRLLQKNPGCSRKELVESLRPGTDPASEEATELLAPLAWLIDKGHIIEFFDGTLAVPLGARREKRA